MARFTITIEDTDPTDANGPVEIRVDKYVPSHEDPQAMTRAGKLATYARIRLFELQLASEQDHGQRMQEAARCCH